jgi:hypothetical protein
MRPGRIDPDQERGARAGLDAALAAGSAILEKRESALDAVEAAVRVLEEDSCFNAGRGSVLTESGSIELDAAIMDGRERRAGAVAGLRTTRAPISLARRLLDHGPHVFLSGKGADDFARAHGFEQVDNSWFEIAERRRQLDERHRIVGGIEEDGRRVGGVRQRLGLRSAMTAHDDLAVDEALRRETSGVRRLAVLGAMNDEDDTCSRDDARDERAHAQALVHATARAAMREVVAAAHAAFLVPSLGKARRSCAAPRSSGIGAETTMRSPVTG